MPKISALPAAASLAATDEFPINASGTTKKVTGTTLFTSPTLVTPALGTPTSGTLTNCSGLPAAGVTGTALVASAIGTTVQAYDADLTTWAGITPGANVGTFLATPSSANLRAALTDETGSGAAVFADTPTLIAPILGTPTSGTLTNCSGLPAAGYATMVGDSGAGGTKGAVPAPAAGDATKFLRGDATWVAGTAAPVTYTISNKTTAYTVVAGDLGKIINCTSGVFTVDFTAAATLGAGFNCWVWNTSATATDVITLDGSGAETIDGKTTITLRRGEGVQIVCDGTNLQTGDKKTMRGYQENISTGQNRASATGDLDVAIGAGASATGGTGFAAGFDASTTVSRGTSIGCNSGANGSRVATGSGAMALGGSYASGADALAAAIANNTSSYGATGANAIAQGYLAKATGAGSSAWGKSAWATGAYSIAICNLGTTIGFGCLASAINGVAIGDGALAATVYGKMVYTQVALAAQGDTQTGLLVLAKGTTDATATGLSSNGSTAGAANQLILPSNSAYAFDGIVVSRRNAAGGTESAAWKVEGLIRREGSAATTTLVASTVTAISNVPGWTLALTADTTNGGLAVTFTGAAATNIRTVATLRSSEVTYA